MKTSLMVGITLISSMVAFQPAFADSKLREDWQKAKEKFEETFDDVYKEEVTDKELDSDGKKKLGLDEGKKRSSYLKFGAKLGPNIDKWVDAKKAYDEKYDEYAKMGWATATTQDEKTAIELAKESYVTHEYDIYKKLQGVNSSSLNLNQAIDLIQDAYNGNEGYINFGADANAVWHGCGQGNCGTDPVPLRAAVLAAQQSMLQMLGGDWRRIVSSAINKTTAFKDVIKDNNDAVTKVKTSCGTYETRIKNAKKQIKEKKIDKALDKLEKAREKICEKPRAL